MIETTPVVRQKRVTGTQILLLILCLLGLVQVIEFGFVDYVIIRVAQSIQHAMNQYHFGTN